jgi:integrase
MLAARWDQFGPDFATWTKPAATTKQKSDHSVPLPPEARLLLAGLRKACDDSSYVFPGRLGGHRLDIKDAWHLICKAAKITGCRVHDLRHTYASNLASSGYGLHTIGKLLGHTTANTTHRYAHLTDASLREAVESVGTDSAKVVPLERGRR